MVALLVITAKESSHSNSRLICYCALGAITPFSNSLLEDDKDDNGEY